MCATTTRRGAWTESRLWLYDQERPPAASKVMVHGVGQSGRTLTMDMIAVPRS